MAQRAHQMRQEGALVIVRRLAGQPCRQPAVARDFRSPLRHRRRLAEDSRRGEQHDARVDGVPASTEWSRGAPIGDGAATLG
ncbi:hypothetical protein [Mesorhizobium sp. M7A.F.Ca.US.006.01.1.1]|uniref:hypothetical protein n=1 Tax=Mesorhizobium sp. M7A.F.Ca.US.006.01.1.1 TaxID=2496707 RepID=UPI0019D29E8E|nr:hypothetical protein [Mesorhizobium sp. M7A.F.Ca.US.006.01.1.1]